MSHLILVYLSRSKNSQNQARRTAILSCRYGPHEKSWKIGFVHLIWNPGQVLTTGCGETPGRAANFHFGPVEWGFPGQRTTTKAPSLHTNCNWLRRRDWDPPAGTEGFSSNLFNLASSSLGRFRRMNPRWKTWNPPAKRRRHFCSRVAKGTNDRSVFKEGTHTFGAISPKPYMKRPDLFVRLH